MSRPPISYPSPLPSASFTPPHSAQAGSSRPSLDPSPMPGGSGLGYDGGFNANARRTSGSSSRTATTAMDSHVTRLLVTTKQMLQGLDAWAQGNVDEDGVSDIYVRLGDGFEKCVLSFQRAGISTTELDPIPQQLRICLEQCLSEEPCKETLDQYLPEIRTIIYDLLSGLKTKQAAYKRLIQERQAIETPPRREIAPPPPDTRLSARSARSGSGSFSQASASPVSVASQLPQARVPSSMALAERARTGSNGPSRPPPPDAFRPPRRVPPDGPRRSVSPSPAEQPQHPQLVRHQLVDNPVPAIVAPQAPTPPPKIEPPHMDRFSRDSFGNPRPVSRFSVDSEVTVESTGRSSLSHGSPAKTLLPLPEAAATEAIETVSTPTPSMPPSLPTLNLPSSGFQFADSDPDPEPEPPLAPSLPDVPPETRATLAALGRSDALERRASKRFSSYTFNKLPGSPSHKKAASVGSPQRPTRRVDRPPPMPALPESLASSNLAIASAAADGIRTPSPTEQKMLSLPNGDDSRSSSSKRDDASDGNSDTGSVRVVKTPEPVDPSDIGAQVTPRPPDSAVPARPPSPPTSSFKVFLQVGRQVKKATMEPGISFPSLRLLFMEKFEYDPGMDDFPNVYIRDTTTGVQYELEDMDDLREGSLLSLDIEPLDQVRQHIDQSFASMMQEFKELKTAFDHSRRISMTPAASLLTVSPSSHFTRPSPVIKPIQDLTPVPKVEPDLSPTNTVRTVAPRQADIRAQQDEIESLRRDLAIMRQFHVDFLSETKDAFTKLRAENSSMRDLVKTKMGGSRELLDNSKGKLETLCADTIQAVEEVSDIIDAAREDAFKRFVTPSRTKMASISSDLAKASSLVEQFSKQVASAEPIARATWHLELSRVMEEQKLLPHQNKLTVDLKKDIEDAQAMFSNVSAFVDQRATNAGKGISLPGRVFKTDEAEGEGKITNLLMEIRTKESDPNQRLRAIEAQQKAREKEKAGQVDEFSEELAGFVQGRKLKRTGGTDEVDRQRQRKQDMTIKRMLSGSTGPGPGEGSPTGWISPQTTGMSVLSPNMTGGSMASGRASRASGRSEADIKQERE